jgi:hypothetical protein
MTTTHKLKEETKKLISDINNFEKSPGLSLFQNCSCFQSKEFETFKQKKLKSLQEKLEPILKEKELDNTDIQRVLLEITTTHKTIQEEQFERNKIRTSWTALSIQSVQSMLDPYIKSLEMFKNKNIDTIATIQTKNEEAHAEQDNTITNSPPIACLRSPSGSEDGEMRPSPTYQKKQRSHSFCL